MHKFVILFVFVYGVFAQSKYFIGQTGQSCNEVCYEQGMNCNPAIQTNNSTDIFTQLGVSCTPDSEPWWAEDQPSYISGVDPNHGKCLGYTGVPSGVLCSGSFPASSRLCRCDVPSANYATFGTALAGFDLPSANETWVFSWHVAQGDFGVMQHFWTTAPNPTEDDVIIRYYVDGEENASIAFQPSLACGVGFADTTAPWGTKWFGKGANDGGYFWNFRVPFQKSILVTAQHTTKPNGGFYMIVRGTTNSPIVLGDYRVPSNAKLLQFTNNAAFQPMDWVTIASLPSGAGIFFMHTIAVKSGSMNFLEGCYHLIYPGQDFPGTLLSSGTEDYFDSAWYFNAGEFNMPVSGFTHLNTTDGIAWSAYRFHDMDPVVFSNGFQILWRNGDMLDAAGIKCLIQEGGKIVGNPTVSQVQTYGWVYTW